MNRGPKLVVFLTIALSAALASAQLNFTATEYTSGDNSTLTIVNGDFNNDGILDVVTINSSTLSFYKGLGSGKFAAPVNQTLPANIGNQAAAADFNRDGRLDLAVSSYSNGPSQVTILLGNGNGSFTQGTNVATTGMPFYLALADFNGDHLPDLVASSFATTGNVTQVFLGEGDGTFKESASLTNGGGPVVAGDFNSDGHQDIAVGGGPGLVMYLGDGNGSFQSPVTANVQLENLAVGDFFNNRIQSLALLTFVDNGGNFVYSASSARYSNGSITMTTPQQINSNQFFDFIAGGDLNGDLKDDVVVSGGEKFGSGALNYYLIGNGDGTFQSAVVLPEYAEAENTPFVRDINLDSRHDIGEAWTNGYIVSGGGAHILMNTNAATNCAPPKPNALSVHICAPASGQVVGKTFTFKGSGNAFNGIAKRMELWIDGKKVGQNLEDQLRVTTSLSRGSHKASFIVVDSFDEHVANSVSFTASY